MRYVRKEASWTQAAVVAEENTIFESVDLASATDDERKAALASVANRLHTSLDLGQGPLVRCAFFDYGPKTPGRLLLVIHHLVVDGVSWRILLEDLQYVASSLQAGRSVELSPKTTSFQYWSERLSQFARSEELAHELEYWIVANSSETPPLPRDLLSEENRYAAAQTVRCSLEPAETRTLLQEVPQAYLTRINDVLLTALAQATSIWTGQRRLRVDLEGHGREGLFDDVDVSRTVGWFTSLYPVSLSLPTTEAPGEALKAIKEQLRQVPNGGIGYGMLRWLRGDREIETHLADRPKAEMSFNYLGQFDQLHNDESLFSVAEESTGEWQSPRACRPYLIDVIARVQDGRLHVDWVYSTTIHHRSTIQKLADGFMRALRGLIEHCLSPDSGGFTPSDFPLAEVDAEELDALAELLDKIDDGDQ
jgi:non-ribosomal peptide synthase protein (TIGR01720 family)